MIHAGILPARALLHEVGQANSVINGWGNLDGGAVQFIMPLVFEAIHKIRSTCVPGGGASGAN